MTQYGVFEWNKEGSYPGHKAVKMYWRECWAQKYADKLNAKRGNYVVREVKL